MLKQSVLLSPLSYGFLGGHWSKMRHFFGQTEQSTKANKRKANSVKWYDDKIFIGKFQSVKKNLSNGMVM